MARNPWLSYPTEGGTQPQDGSPGGEDAMGKCRERRNRPRPDPVIPGSRGQRGEVRPGGTTRYARVIQLRGRVARRGRGSGSRHTRDRTPTHLRALLPPGRSRGTRHRAGSLHSADHSRSPRRTHRGREPTGRGSPYVLCSAAAAGRGRCKLPRVAEGLTPSATRAVSSQLFVLAEG